MLSLPCPLIPFPMLLLLSKETSVRLKCCQPALVLASPHCLPFKHRRDFKNPLFIYKAFYNQIATYNWPFDPMLSNQDTQVFRSGSSYYPRSKSKTRADRAFMADAPRFPPVAQQVAFCTNDVKVMESQGAPILTFLLNDKWCSWWCQSSLQCGIL